MMAGEKQLAICADAPMRHLAVQAQRPRLECSPIPVNGSKADIHTFAERAARRFSFRSTDSIDFLVHRLGGRIEHRNAAADDRLPESIRVESERSFTIFIPTTTSLARDRFTIAHELGHYFLHYPIVAKLHPGAIMVATRWVKEDDRELQRAEWEANWFAAGFLMPEEQFRGVYALNIANIRLVAKWFSVSPKAVETRAKSLGLT
jgi:predicted transcriptional regulator